MRQLGSLKRVTPALIRTPIVDSVCFMRNEVFPIIPFFFYNGAHERRLIKRFLRIADQQH